MIAEALSKVVAGGSLSVAEMEPVIEAIMQGGADERLVAALLVALRVRGETTDELVGAAHVVRRLAVPLPEAPRGAVDTCGTGGDGPSTFNISTAAAIVAAGAGTTVAKHGNRKATSMCGSAEVLEALGVPLELPPERMAQSVFENGIGFLFARACHPAFAAIGPLRVALGVPTLFNRLGPLVNPMRVRCHLLGVGSADQAEQAVEALAQLGAERAWVVHSEDGLDELSTAAPTEVHAYVQGRFERFQVDPSRYVEPAQLSDLASGDAQHNAALIRRILAGEPGPARDVVVLNAAAALVVAAHPEAKDLESAVGLAQRTIDSGAAAASLERWAGWCAQEASHS